jgi:hypothetical protein
MLVSKEDIYITIPIGTCMIKYSQNASVRYTEWSTVNVTCPSVGLLTTVSNCQMALKQKDNVKLNDKTVTITELQDGTKIRMI